MKAVWGGSIGFGLVDIPIKLYSATEPRAISFKMLCGRCNTPIKYERHCPKCKKEVAWENIVYGLELGKKKLKVFTREQLEKLKPEKSELAEVVAFTDMSSIDPIYYQKSYYVIPARNKEKAFFLFSDVLRSTARIAIVKIIMRNKQHIAMIRPYKNVLLLTTLLYNTEIRKLEKFEELVSRPKISTEELKLANKLIDKYSKKDVNLSEYKDEFSEKIKDIVLGKVKIIKKVEAKPEKLIEALKLSVK